MATGGRTRLLGSRVRTDIFPVAQLPVDDPAFWASHTPDTLAALLCRPGDLGLTIRWHLGDFFAAATHDLSVTLGRGLGGIPLPAPREREWATNGGVADAGGGVGRNLFGAEWNGSASGTDLGGLTGGAGDYSLAVRLWVLQKGYLTWGTSAGAVPVGEVWPSVGLELTMNWGDGQVYTVRSVPFPEPGGGKRQFHDLVVGPIDGIALPVLPVVSDDSVPGDAFSGGALLGLATELPEMSLLPIGDALEYRDRLGMDPVYEGVAPYGTLRDPRDDGF